MKLICSCKIFFDKLKRKKEREIEENDRRSASFSRSPGGKVTLLPQVERHFDSSVYECLLGFPKDFSESCADSPLKHVVSDGLDLLSPSCSQTDLPK